MSKSSVCPICGVNSSMTPLSDLCNVEELDGFNTDERVVCDNCGAELTCIQGA
jgi:hypothetical protein